MYHLKAKSKNIEYIASARRMKGFEKIRAAFNMIKSGKSICNLSYLIEER